MHTINTYIRISHNILVTFEQYPIYEDVSYVYVVLLILSVELPCTLFVLRYVDMVSWVT